MPDSLFDAMEQKYAPPEHPVFELVPPAFEIRAQHYYSAQKLEAVGSKTFWNIYSAFLLHLQVTANHKITNLAVATSDIAQLDVAHVARVHGYNNAAQQGASKLECPFNINITLAQCILKKKYRQ